LRRWLVPCANRYSTFNTQFDDFFITSIDGDNQTSTQFWGILLNFQFIPVGGCQQIVKLDQNVLFAFDAFNAEFFLQLTGPQIARVGETVIFNVKDGRTGVPVPGADVAGITSDNKGNVIFSFTQTGVVALKADKSGSIRSNELVVFVVVPKKKKKKTQFTAQLEDGV